jgi:hypothetical protein
MPIFLGQRPKPPVEIWPSAGCRSLVSEQLLEVADAVEVNGDQLASEREHP